MFDKKILCLGNNSLDTDQRTSNLASQDSTVNHGVIDSIDFLPELPGYYHTSIIDLSAGEIIKIAKKFNNIILLDQPRSEWSHETVLKSTISLMVNLDQLGLPTKYKDNNNLKNINFWNKLVTENKSFCIHPWILMNEIDGKAVLCPRDSNPVTNKSQNIISWQTDANYQSIRQRMLEGTIIPDHCGVCYDYEDRGIESYRQFETKEWANRLHLNSLDDLKNITAPYFYDIRLSNKCNMMCRSCNPLYSNLIAKESKKFNIVYKVSPSYTYSKLDCIDIDRLTPKTRVYLTGGEPTVMTEIYDWMQQCIDAGQTDFDFTLGTNGQRLNKRFLKLIKHFTNLNFSISLDGYGRINEYWRWGSNFDTITKNIHTLKNQGHNISINCVPGIYNVTNLHLLLEFLDQELPMTTIYMQLNYVDFQSAYNHPIPELVLKSMERCKNTSVYYADGKSNKTTIDSLYDYYSSNPTCDLALLKEFFDYNDKLDQARNVRLVDYIPELEACRKYLK